VRRWTPREDDGNESIYKLAAEELPLVALEELSEEVILLKVESDQMKEEDHEVVNQDYDKKWVVTWDDVWSDAEKFWFFPVDLFLRVRRYMDGHIQNGEDVYIDEVENIFNVRVNISWDGKVQKHVDAAKCEIVDKAKEVDQKRRRADEHGQLFGCFNG
jgi:hypothetical protein